MDLDREDGEMSDDGETEMMDHDDNVKHTGLNENTASTIFYQANRNGLLVKKLDKIDAFKIEERAKRFGIDLTGNKMVTQKQIDELYSNFGIESGNERHFRFDSLHLHGVNELSTQDIFEYLQDYKPLSIEWIDENSCNVVCQDHISAALALLVHSQEIGSEEVRKMISTKSSYHWREGTPYPNTDMILMRFSTNSDKKNAKKVQGTHKVKYGKTHKNPWGDLCQSWGVYDHQEVFQRSLANNDYEDEYHDDMPSKPIAIRNGKLAKRLGKRHHTVASNEEDSDSDLDWKSKSKTPRMRMHADDEESKQRQTVHVEVKDEYAPLSIEVLNQRSSFRPKETKIVSQKFKSVPNRLVHSSSIQSRLGAKVSNKDDCSSDESVSDNSEHNVMSKVEKINSNQSSSVWSRLDIERNSGQSDLRQVLKTKQHKSNDLRQKIGKAKHTNLRIEIDNS